MYASVTPAVLATIAGPGPLLRGCDGIAMMRQERFSNRDWVAGPGPLLQGFDGIAMML